MEEGNDPLPPDTYFTPHSGWVSPYRGVEGARSHLRAGSMAVRAVYDEVTALSCRVISGETVITQIAEAIGVVQKKVNEKARAMKPNPFAFYMVRRPKNKTKYFLHNR